MSTEYALFLSEDAISHYEKQLPKNLSKKQAEAEAQYKKDFMASISEEEHRLYDAISSDAKKMKLGIYAFLPDIDTTPNT